MKKQREKKNYFLKKEKDILGEKLYDELSEIKEEVKLGRGVFGSFLISVF